MRNTKWNIKNIPKDKDIKINNIPVDKDILKILFSRGIKSPGEIRDFLNPKLENLQNPNKLYDVEKSVKIIREAIRKNKNIWIYGDYDVDGITSTAVLYLALKELGAENVSYYIPIRDEGYGLNNDALKKIKDSGGELVITVDCGITAFEEIKFANSINLPVIITDHHNLQGKKVPEALAVINPKRIENEYTFESLAGVGTVFMLVLSLFESYGKKEEAFEYLDLVSIGTIADIVPLLSENRILTRFGLEKLPFTKNRGLAFLLYKLFNSGEKKGNNPKSEYSTYDVGFIIAPVFNAAGRLKDAKMVVKLLTSDNNREIEIIVKELINKNFERKELQSRIVEMIEKNIEKNKINEDFVIIDYSPEYHHGIIGIAASKIVDTYYKPVIIMEVKEDEGIAVGSCRSIEGFNILNALQSMPELFVKFGGHAGAAGFTIPIKNIELFKRKINEYAKKILKDDDFIKIINIDKQIPMQKMSYEFFKTIPVLERKLQTLIDVGMNYIKLGQPATTLSGGEAQRIKLATELSKVSRGKTIYILDEPTTGLHFEDIRKLLVVLDRLVEKGNTVLVIEHNLDVIKFADYIIDVGPEGGHKGGQIIAKGTPEQIAKSKKSHTGKFLKKYLK